MKGLLLVIGLRKTGYETTPMERMAISPQLDAEIENLNPPLTIEELSQILYAAKMEYGEISRRRAKAHLTPAPADLLPCGHHKDALVDNGDRQWCVACEVASR